MKSLGEVKQSCFTSKLATKHVLLTMVVSFMGSSLMRSKAQVLGVHPQNIGLAVERRRIMNQSGDFLWNLSLRKKRSDVLSPSIKVVISWWVSETRISPNRKEVTQSQIFPHVANEKPTHYLMETQVSNSSLFSLVSCIALGVFHYQM